MKGSTYRSLTSGVVMRWRNCGSCQIECAYMLTSPPYWGSMRDYGHKDQIGTESDPKTTSRNS